MIAFNPPPIRGLGTAGGFEFYLQDRGDGGPRARCQVTQPVPRRGARATRSSPACNTFYRADGAAAHGRGRPREGAGARRAAQDVFDALQSTIGSALRERLQQVRPHLSRADVRPSAPFRAQPEDLGDVYVRSRRRGEMIPLNALVDASRDVVGPGARSTASTASRRPRSSGSAGARRTPRARRSRRSRRSPPRRCPGLHASPGPARRSRRSAPAGTSALALRASPSIMVFLILAAQYERWSLPFAVLLAVPFAVLRRARSPSGCAASTTTSTSRSAW